MQGPVAFDGVDEQNEAGEEVLVGTKLICGCLLETISSSSVGSQWESFCGPDRFIKQ